MVPLIASLSALVTDKQRFEYNLAAIDDAIQGRVMFDVLNNVVSMPLQIERKIIRSGNLDRLTLWNENVLSRALNGHKITQGFVKKIVCAQSKKLNDGKFTCPHARNNICRKWTFNPYKKSFKKKNNKGSNKSNKGGNDESK